MMKSALTAALLAVSVGIANAQNVAALPPPGASPSNAPAPKKARASNPHSLYVAPSMCLNADGTLCQGQRSYEVPVGTILPHWVKPR